MAVPQGLGHDLWRSAGVCHARLRGRLAQLFTMLKIDRLFGLEPDHEMGFEYEQAAAA